MGDSGRSWSRSGPGSCRTRSTSCSSWRRWRCPARGSQHYWNGSAGCGGRKPRGEVRGDGQSGLNVVAVRPRCAAGRFRRMSQGGASCALGSGRDGTNSGSVFGENPCHRTFGGLSSAVGVVSGPRRGPSGKGRFPGHILLRSGTQPDVWGTHDELATEQATSEPLGQPTGHRRLAASARCCRTCSAHRFLGIVVEIRRDVADSRWPSCSNSRDRLGLRRYGNRSADWRVVGTGRPAQ